MRFILKPLWSITLWQGLIKIRGDQCWRDLTCMNYHYEASCPLDCCSKLKFWLLPPAIFMHKRIYSCTRACTHLHVHAHIYTCMHTSTQTHLYTHAHINTPTHINTCYTHIHTYTHAHINTSTHINTCIYAHTYTNTPGTHAHTFVCNTQTCNIDTACSQPTQLLSTPDACGCAYGRDYGQPRH